jgi:hypothetical protein
MNQNAIAAWIGRKCRLREGDNIASQREYTLLEVLEEGTRNVVFRAADNYGESIIEFPRNHLGFHICMPPSRLFPEFQGDKRYDERLLSNVTALQGSDVVSVVFPLEGLWNALAVRRLRVSDLAEQSMDDEDYLELGACDLVNGKLIEWAACDIGRADDEMVVIYENEKPIYTDSAPALARDAQAALERIPFEKNGLRSTSFAAAHVPFGEPVSTFPEHALGDATVAVSPLRENPLLLWIAAGSSGFGLPKGAVALAAAALQKLRQPDLAIKQAHLAIRYAGRHADWDERLALLDFMNRLVGEMPRKAVGAEDIF